MPEEEKMSLAWKVAYIGAALAFFVGGILQSRKQERYLRKREDERT